MSENTVLLPGEKSAKITKWNVKRGAHVTKGTVLAVYVAVDCQQPQKLRCSRVGTVDELLASEGDTVRAGEPLLILSECSHPTVMKDMCAECGADLREALGRPGDRKESVTASVAMVHTIPELIVSHDQALELGKADEQRLLNSRKLVLLVDLDQTLIHTTNENVPPNLKDVFHFQLWHGPKALWYHTKIRPDTETFLDRIAELYELHICTFGARMYAHTIAGFLDPKKKYFSHRILSRDECFNPNSKTANLKALFPCGDSMICIIDDREDVWSFSPNLVHVKPYIFFEGTADINAPPGCQKGPANPSLTLKRKVKIIKVPRKKKHKDKHENNEKLDENTTVKSEQHQESGYQVDSKEESSDSKQESGDSKDESGDSKRESGDSKDEPGDSKQESGDSKRESGDAKEESGDSKQESGDFKQGSGDSKQKSDESNQETNGSLETKDSKPESSDIKPESSDLKPESSDTNQESSKTDLNDANEMSASVESSDPKQDLDATPDESNHSKGSNQESESKMEVQEDSGDREKSPASAMEVDNSNSSNESVTMHSNTEKSEGEIDDSDEYEEQIEWVDDDDYLVSLSGILERIHTAYYQMYDELKTQGDINELPSLKNIIPYVRRKTLAKCRVMFTGVIPTNMAAEKHRLYMVAKNLGATIHSDYVSPSEDKDGCTTHVIARGWTAKARKAIQQDPKIRIVTPEWLWECHKNWVKANEKQYKPRSGPDDDADTPQGSPAARTLKRKRLTNETRRNKSQKVDKQDNDGGKEASQDTESSSSESDVINEEIKAGEERKPAMREQRKFSETYNPLYAFSDEELAGMGKEVEDILDESDSEDSEQEDSKREIELRKKVLHGKEYDSTSEDSLGANFPHGWGRRKKSSSSSPQPQDENTNDGVKDDDEDDYEGETARDQPHRVFKHSSSSSSSEKDSEDNESIGSVDEEMAAAVERDFLSY